MARRLLRGRAYTILGAAGWVLLCIPTAMAEAPQARPLTPAQQQQLKLRDRYAAETGRFRQQGKLAEAIAVCAKMLAIERTVFGNLHEEVVGSLEQLAQLHEQREDFAAARKVRQEILGILTMLHGETDWRVTDARFALADSERLAQMGPELRQFVAEAKQRSRRSLELEQRDKYGEATQDALEVVELQKKIWGDTHPRYSASLEILAGLYRAQGDFVRAEPRYRNSLEIDRKTLGEGHPHYGAVLHDLALLYKEQGDYTRAETLYQQALEVTQKALGEAHPRYASFLNDLGILYQWTRAYDRAEALHRRAMEIRKKAAGELDPEYASALTGLGNVYLLQRDYVRAEPLLRQSLDLTAKMDGTTHLHYAERLEVLANLYWSTRDYAHAEPLYLQALAIRKNLLGEAHPNYARNLNSLANLYQGQGDTARAEPLYRAALEIVGRNLELTSAIQSERQQLAMARSFLRLIDTYLSIGPVKLPADRAYQQVLAWKGTVFARQRRLRLSRHSSDPELNHLFQELEETASQLAAFTFQRPTQAEQSDRQQHIQALTARKEQLESRLAVRSADFRSVQALVRTTPSQVQAALPPDTALIDFLEFTYFTQRGGANSTYPHHFAAFVVRRDHPIVYLDLGPAEPIVTAVETWRQQVMTGGRTSDGDGKDAGAELHRLVWQPLEPYLRTAHTVLVSPDGALGRFPFAALPGSRPGTYLIDNLRFAVIPAPQLLPQVRAEAARREGRASNALLLVGDVDFGAPPGEPSSGSFAGQVAMRGGRGIHFPALPGTADEIASIRAAFEQAHPNADVCLLRGAKATERSFRRTAAGKSYLHLATHGFFAPPELKSALDSASGFNPGLLSGLALAGCNRDPRSADDRSKVSDDGILTALEVGELDLSAAELVVLSACETGLGKVAGGEGLMGLQRAFQVAGARTVVASLWKVDDEATRQLMTSFYENLWKHHLPPLEALRQAQLQILHRSATAGRARGLGTVERVVAEKKPGIHPRLWAAWVLSGEPGNLFSPAPPDPIRTTAVQAQIGGTFASLVLVLAGLSALQVRRLSRGRTRS